jgi:hypothetical protein
MRPHGGHAITTIIESRGRTQTAYTSAGKVCPVATESGCSSKATTVKGWRGAGTTPSKPPDAAATANVAASKTASAAARPCPRWLTKTNKSDPC